MKKKQFRLKGHETFVPREGWLSKGIVSLKENKSLFSEFAGADALGVGSNMAKAIRYWLKAMEVTADGRGETVFLPTGDIIKENDPYLEDIFSLWILHINLVSNIELATTWYLFFNLCESEEFQKDELFHVLQQHFISRFPGEKYSEKSLDSDVSILLNMYTKTKQKDYDPEDKTRSPFSELELIKRENGSYKKQQPNVEKMNPLLVLYCVAGEGMENSISIDDLINMECGPGKVMNLNRVTLNEFLDSLEEDGYLKVTRTAGLDMVYFDKEYTKKEVLEIYYNN